MLPFPAYADGGLQRALAMHGEAAFPDGPPASFPWTNPDAPVGGTLNLAEVGTFDSVNPYIVLGIPARGLGLVYQTLMYRSPDEPFTFYPQVAEAIELADDRTSIVFHLDPAARFQDGSPITTDDILFTFGALKESGKPHNRTYYAGVTEARAVGDHAVRFDMAPGNWELPLILCLMPVLSEAYFTDVPFDRTSLEIPLGSGPYRMVEIDPGRRVIYGRNDDFWGWHLPQYAGRFNFQTIVYSWYRDSNVALQAFIAGDADVRFEHDVTRWATAYDAPAVADGEIVLEALPHGRPSGLLGVVWNQRRAPFDDIRVREALALAFDFTWTNENLLHGQYARTGSLFGNSPLAAEGAAVGAELALLEPWRDVLPPDLFEQPFAWPETDGSGRLRDALRQAAAGLEEAGFETVDGVLVDPTTQEPLAFELLLSNSAFERIMLPWFANLERLGIRPMLRTIDAAQYQTRIAAFDFDAIIWNWGVSLSPGNEQQIYWGSDAAASEGSRNYAGIADPVVDDLIATLVDARTPDDLQAAARALDRVLLWGRHVLPLYHGRTDNAAHWRSIGHTGDVPLYGVDLMSWWHTDLIKAVPVFAQP